jgi:toxin ParE1/3/4
MSDKAAVRFLPAAKKEFDEALSYYETLEQGLGATFLTEVHKGLRLIERWPLACAVESLDMRRVVLKRFPYKLIYAIERDHILIVALAHQHRAPEYWHGRAV